MTTSKGEGDDPREKLSRVGRSSPARVSIWYDDEDYANHCLVRRELPHVYAILQSAKARRQPQNPG
jgi:hypothetical protein